MMLNLIKVAIFGVMLCFVLTACDDSMSPPQGAAPAVSRVVKKPAVVPVESEDQVETKYVYDPRGTRDPFKNPFNTLVELPTDNSIPLTPLQKVGLDQLRVIGVIVGKGEPKAMVISPDNKSFVLKKGTKIGRNNGSVSEITTEAIMVEEQYLDFSGEIKIKMQEIKLPKQGGVK